MGEVSMRMLNQETSRVLARVKRGEEVTLTERGVVVARIVPASPGPLDALVSDGRVVPASTHGPAPRASVRSDHELDAGALLERMREQERY